MPQGLTVLAAIRPGEEERLRDVLRSIGDDIPGRTLKDAAERPHIDFCRSRTIHFARFAILDDPDRGPERKRLLYSSNYDGDLDGHLAELMAITSDMDAIWGRCEAYTGAARFGAFIRAHAREPEAFYIAFRDETVERIRQSIALRRQVQPLLDAASAGSLATILPGLSTGEPAWAGAIRRVFSTAGRDIGAAIERLIRALPIVVDLPRAIVRFGFTNVFRGALTDHRQPRPISGVPVAQLDHPESPAAAEIDVLERRPRQLRRPCSDRAGRRDPSRARIGCLRRSGRMSSPRTSSR